MNPVGTRSRASGLTGRSAAPGSWREATPTMLSALLWVPLALCLAGCQTNSPSQYVSPRVTGRVLDAQTHQPVADVQVSRVSANEDLRGLDVPKGGQAMETAPAVRTGADGTFVLDSERSLTFFRRSGWYSVTLSFRHEHFHSFVATYTLKDATNSPSGEPLVQAKDILLIPLAR